jgi:hypothetical protein
MNRNKRFNYRFIFQVSGRTTNGFMEIVLVRLFISVWAAIKNGTGKQTKLEQATVTNLITNTTENIADLPADVLEEHERNTF